MFIIKCVTTNRCSKFTIKSRTEHPYARTHELEVANRDVKNMSIHRYILNKNKYLYRDIFSSKNLSGNFISLKIEGKSVTF